MATRLTSVGSLKVGNYVVIDGAACIVKSIQISRPGKHGHAKSRIEAVGIIDEQKRIIVRPSHDNIEVPIIEKKTAQVLSVQADKTKANVMDMETYETFDIEIPEEIREQVEEGKQVMYWIVLNSRIIKQVK